MKATGLFLFHVLLLAILASLIQAQLLLKDRVPLPTTTGKINFPSIDPEHGHLYIPATESKACIRIDLKSSTDEYTTITAGTTAPSSCHYIPGFDKLVVANEDGLVAILDAQTHSILAQYSTEGNVADFVRYDADSEVAFVGCSTYIAAFNMSDNTRLANASGDLGFHPQGFVIRPEISAIVANVRHGSGIWFIKPTHLGGDGSQTFWPLPVDTPGSNSGNNPIAWVPSLGVYLVASRTSKPDPSLYVINETGSVIQKEPIYIKDADGVWFQEPHIFVSGIDGVATLFWDGHEAVFESALYPPGYGPKESLLHGDTLYLSGRSTGTFNTVNSVIMMATKYPDPVVCTAPSPCPSTPSPSPCPSTPSPTACPTAAPCDSKASSEINFYFQGKSFCPAAPFYSFSLNIP